MPYSWESAPSSPSPSCARGRRRTTTAKITIPHRIETRIRQTPNAEAYSEGGFEDIERECGGDGLLECVQGAPVVGVEDSTGLDVGDGPLDDLADPVDALVGLLRGLAQLAVGGFLWDVIILS